MTFLALDDKLIETTIRCSQHAFKMSRRRAWSRVVEDQSLHFTFLGERITFKLKKMIPGS